MKPTATIESRRNAAIEGERGDEKVIVMMNRWKSGESAEVARKNGDKILVQLQYMIVGEDSATTMGPRHPS